MEIAFIESIFVHFYAGFNLGFKCQSLFDNECASLLYQGGVVLEAFHIGLFGAVDVEVVGVGRGDNAHPGVQPVERTVELVGLDNHKFALRTEDVVGAIVFGNATQKCITVGMTLVHDVRTHARSGGFAMRSSKAKALKRLG